MCNIAVVDKFVLIGLHGVCYKKTKSKAICNILSILGKILPIAKTVVQLFQLLLQRNQSCADLTNFVTNYSYGDGRNGIKNIWIKLSMFLAMAQIGPKSQTELYDLCLWSIYDSELKLIYLFFKFVIN